MTVINNNARDQYTASNGQTIFNYTFEISDQDNIQVYQRASSAAPDDVADLLVITTDYTVTGVGVNTGGTIVLVSGAALNDVITLQGNAPPVRSTSFTPGGTIQAANLNTEFDDEVLIYQTILATQDFLIPKYPKSAVVQDFDIVLPILDANQTWVMNDDGDEIVAADFPSEGAASRLSTYLTLTDATAQEPNSINLAALGSGIMVNNAGVAILMRTLTGTANQIDIANGTGVSNNPTFSISSNPTIPGTAGMGVPSGTTAQRVIPTPPSVGLRINTDLDSLEFYVNGAWTQIEDSGDFTDLLALLASHVAGEGASLIGLETPSTSTVQDFSEAGFILKTANNATPNAQAMGALGTGIVRNTTTTGVQSIDAAVTAFSNLSFAADKLPYATGATAFALTDLTSYMRTVLDDTTAAAAAVTLAVLPLLGGTMLGNLTLVGDPSTALMAATKQYVDNIAFNVHPACNYGTTANLAGYTYLNGTLGVGATLTAGGNGAFTTDGASPTLGSRILVPQQSTTFQNGIYTLTQVGTAGTPAILTRATDYDQAAEMQAGDRVDVVAGATLAGTQWMMTQTAAITVGTTAITWLNITNTGALLVANNLSELTATASTARGNISAAMSGANNDITSLLGMTGEIRGATEIADSAGNPMFTFGYIATPVNYFLFQNAATGDGIDIFAQGSDASIPLNLLPKNAWVSILDVTNTIGGTLRFWNAAYTFYTQLKVADAAGTSVTFTLPSLDGASGTSLKTNASGVLSFLTLPSITQVKTVLVASTSTYTPTANSVGFSVAGAGAGGGGGGAATTGAGQAAAGCGGGYGGYFFKTFTLAEMGANAAVTIGAAGTAGAAGNNAGAAGGDTIFNPAGTGATLTGTGGAGGAGQGAQGSLNINDGGGAGGTASNGDLNIPGVGGFRGLSMAVVSNQSLGGDGASGIWGVGGRGSVNAAGIVGSGYGAGGAGGGTINSAQTAGSAGTLGLVVVTEYISV